MAFTMSKTRLPSYSKVIPIPPIRCAPVRVDESKDKLQRRRLAIPSNTILPILFGKAGRCFPSLIWGHHPLAWGMVPNVSVVLIGQPAKV